MRKKKFWLFFSAIALVVSLFLTCQVSASSKNEMLNKIDRDKIYSTSLQREGSSAEEKYGYAIIVNNENYPDILIASELYKKYNASIIKMDNPLDSNIYDKLKTANVENVFIVGGDSAINPVVEQTINSMGIKTIRLGGKNRNETSVKVAEQIGTNNGIILATDTGFTDALSVVPIAAKLQMPIIFIPKDVVPDSIKSFISGRNIPKTYVLGETDLISDVVANEFPNVERIGGKNKYERNMNIINYFNNYFDFNSVYIAYAEEFKNDLNNEFYKAAFNYGPIILIGDNDLSIKANFDFVKSKIKSAKGLYILDANEGFNADKLYGIFSIDYDLKYGFKVGEVPVYIVWNGKYYQVTGEIVKNVDEKIGTSESTSLGNDIQRNIYSIPGNSSDEEIAIEQLGPTYFQAISISD